MMHRALAAALSFGLMAWPAHAEREASTGEQLEATETALKEASEREQALTQQKNALEAERSSLQKELVSLAETLQKNEASLMDAEEKLVILNRQLVEKGVAFRAQQKKLAAMMGAAIRLSRTPPEAALMMPGEFSRTLAAARVLSSLTLSIRAESESISAQLVELEELKDKVQKNRESIRDDLDQLKADQKVMDAKLAERKKLSSKLQKEQESVRKAVTELSRQSKDMQELLEGLEKSREVQKEKEATVSVAKDKTRTTSRLRSVKAKKGKLVMPVAGKIIRRFGAELSSNETSKGVEILARVNAKVVAPFDAEVVFTGPFLNYGTMVILRHSDDMHTLLAGFKNVNVNVGEFLLEGEPIGAMGDGSGDADLYVEMREHNQPIDPAPWISGMSK